MKDCPAIVLGEDAVPQPQVEKLVAWLNSDSATLARRIISGSLAAGLAEAANKVADAKAKGIEIQADVVFDPVMKYRHFLDVFDELAKTKTLTLIKLSPNER